MFGPVASHLVLLNDLDTLSHGTKVRFLGWYVHKTSTTNAYVINHSASFTVYSPDSL